MKSNVRKCGFPLLSQQNPAEQAARHLALGDEIVVVVVAWRMVSGRVSCCCFYWLTGGPSFVWAHGASSARACARARSLNAECSVDWVAGYNLQLLFGLGKK